MPRPADQIFLRLAVKGGYLGHEDADGVWEELCRLEAEGEPTKARLLCLEFGFMDKGLARQIKHEVRSYLEQMARDESRHERRIADFELLDRLSSGAMGSVYRARHLRLGKVVALKLLNPDLARDASYVARFAQEARAAASLDHPNVVQAYDVGQAGDLHYIAMEFVDGKTLKELIDRRGRLEEAAAVEIALQMLDALKHAHENSLVHRDVKPANIMITKEGRAKLLDLGLVRRTDVENGLTGEGKAIGTPYFMAPEQALDKGADYRADLYSLGATLFNMVTGEKPYVASTPVAVMNMHLKAPIPEAHVVEPAVSTGLSKVIAKLLAKRPADRYQDHADLKNDLELVLQGFMPELRTGTAPAGVRFIKPRAGGGRDGPEGTVTRRRLGAAASSSSLPPGLVIGLAAAGLLVLIGGALLLKGSPPPPVPEVADRDLPDRDRDPGPDRAAQEQAAESLYAGLGDRQGERRVEELESLASLYPNTASGRRARQEAEGLKRELRAREQATFDARSAELERLAQAGDLAGAIGGYRALAGELEGAEARDRARARAEALEQERGRRAEQVLARSYALEREGKNADAASALRRAASLLEEDRREEAVARAERLERQELLRRQERSEAAQSMGAEATEQLRARVDALPATLRRLVRDGELQEALDAAEELLGATAGDLRARVQPHVDALAQALALHRAALDGFAEREGESIMLERRAGKSVTGTLAGVRGDAVVVKLSERAEVALAIDDLSERSLWRAARRKLGSKSPAYLGGTTAVLLYRGDDEAAEQLAACAQAGVDLSAIVQTLQPLDAAEADGAVAMGSTGDERPDPNTPATGDPLAGTVAGGGGGADDLQDRYRRALDRNELARRVIANRELLFTEASRIGYADDQLEPIYEFANGEEFGKDWKLLRGRSYPTPPGQTQRYGLVLEGRNGRAEFCAPSVGDVSVRVRFMPQMIGRTGRLAIALDGEEQRRVTNEMGQLLYTVKRRPKAAEGASQAGEVRSQSTQTLELLRRGDRLFSKFNGKVVAELSLDADLGAFQIALEWDRVALNLLSIEVMCRPSEEWLKERLPE